MNKAVYSLALAGLLLVGCTEPVEPAELEPVIVETEKRVVSLEAMPEKEVRISFYCNCPICCGKWYTPEAIGKAGVPLVEGKHCAATKDIPLGSVVEVDGTEYIVADRVADWIYEKYGTCIDIFMGTNHTGALQSGVKECEVKIIAKVY